MRPAIEKPDQPWRKAALIEGGPEQHSLVTDRWRYTEETIRNEESVALYDEQSDPGELTNLAASPEHAATVERLSAMLRGGWKAAQGK